MSKARKSSSQKIEISAKTLIVREFAEIIDAAAAPTLKLNSDEQRISYAFVDDRPHGSMQLTSSGFKCLEPNPHWSSPLHSRMTFGDHTLLIEISRYPYYIDTNRFITFDPDLGMTMKLLDGSFAKLRKLR